jgi:dCMP deaminase
MTGPRTEGILSWDEYFMFIAMLIAHRSKDPKIQVGAVVVSSDNLIVSTGYNGFPRGMDSDQWPWDKEGEFEDTKYPYVCHAEENAVYNSQLFLLTGCRIYCTLFPCNECAKVLIQKKISEVIFLDDRPEDKACQIARKMFDATGIKCRHYSVDHDKMSEIYLSLLKMIEKARLFEKQRPD